MTNCKLPTWHQWMRRWGMTSTTGSYAWACVSWHQHTTDPNTHIFQHHDHSRGAKFHECNSTSWAQKLPLAFGYAVNAAKDTHPRAYLVNSYLTPKVQEKCEVFIISPLPLREKLIIPFPFLWEFMSSECLPSWRLGWAIAFYSI